MNSKKKPESEEYNSYYQIYIDQVSDEGIIDFLSNQHLTFVKYLEELNPNVLSKSYDKGKWTVAEVLGHIIDSERVMAYRLMSVMRNDTTPLPGYDQEAYIQNGDFNSRTLESFIREFNGLRISNNELAKQLNEKNSMYATIANGYRVTAKASLYILAGHLQHHWNILKERYKLL